MRLGWILAICLLWTSAVTFAADSHDTAMTANEALHAEPSADEISAVSGSQGGHYVHSLGRMMLIATLLGAVLSIARPGPFLRPGFAGGAVCVPRIASI